MGSSESVKALDIGEHLVGPHLVREGTLRVSEAMRTMMSDSTSCAGIYTFLDPQSM